MAKIEYDKREKILSIRLSKKRSVDSDVRGNAVVDYDKDGRVVMIEIMPFTLEEFATINNYLPRILNVPRERAMAA
jgi:uncharacterized protein YuzE